MAATVANAGAQHYPYDGEDLYHSPHSHTGHAVYQDQVYRSALCYARIVLISLSSPSPVCGPNHPQMVAVPAQHDLHTHVQQQARPLCDDEPRPGRRHGQAITSTLLTHEPQRVHQHDLAHEACFECPRLTHDEEHLEQYSPLAIVLPSDDDGEASGGTPCS